MDEKELINRLKRNDEAAQRHVLDQYQAKIYRAICCRVSPAHGINESGALSAPDDHDAREIMNDVFFAFFKDIQAFRGGSKLSTWLYAITKHKITDFYRQKYRQPLAPQVPRKPRPTPEDEVSEGYDEMSGAPIPNEEDGLGELPKGLRVSQKNRAFAVTESTSWQSSSPDPAVNARDPRLSIFNALHPLPNKQAAVLICRVANEMSVKETAQFLGMSEGAVKMAQTRATKTLRSSAYARQCLEEKQP